MELIRQSTPYKKITHQELYADVWPYALHTHRDYTQRSHLGRTRHPDCIN